MIYCLLATVRLSLYEVRVKSVITFLGKVCSLKDPRLKRKRCHVVDSREFKFSNIKWV